MLATLISFLYLLLFWQLFCSCCEMWLVWYSTNGICNSYSKLEHIILMNPQGDHSYFISLTGNKGSYIYSTNIYRASALHQAFNKAGYCGVSSGRRGILREYSQGRACLRGSDISSETWRMKRGQPCKELKKGTWQRRQQVERPWGRNELGKLEG